MSDLETRIATALTNGTASADLIALIQEVETAIGATAEVVEQARARALDPTVIDPGARTAVQDAQFRGERLGAALPRLHHRYNKVCEEEALARWLPRYEAVEAKQAPLVDELEELYRDVEAKLPDLLWRIQEVDQEARAVNAAKPEASRGDGRLLRDTELVARGLDEYGPHQSILRDLTLPAWVPSATPAWPPPTVPLGAQVASSMSFSPGPGADWPAHREAVTAARREEAATTAAHHRSMAAQREANENAEVRRAVAARRRGT